MKVSLILKGAVDHFGRYPVYVRNSDGQKRTFKKTDVLLTKEQFDRFKTHSHLPKEKNLYLRYLSLLDEPIKEKKPVKFVLFCLEVAKEEEADKAEETMKEFRTGINKIKGFRPDVLLHEVTPQFLEEYKKHLKKVLNNCDNTMAKTFKFVKKIILRAIKQKLIEENPFDVFQPPVYKDPPRKYLTQEEIDRIDALNDEPLPRQIKHVANWFLIGCYTGLRYGDMHAFDKKLHIREGRLILHTSKTGELVSIPLTEKITSLFERVEYKSIGYRNQKFNEHLKTVGKLAEIDTVLTVHLARHSAAVRWANRGMSQEVVSKLLAHVNLRTTGIYFRITGARVNEEFGKFG